ncbi:condensation protein [Streptomyces venetus]|uniref:condensation protein n=1 Tax=Streptomyces venetus TaxID=1701086 RepID=UPI003C2E8A3D
MTSPTRIPFPVVDEVSRHCLQEEEPETVHIEVHLPGPLDEPRFRKAFTEALHRHPRILMREAQGPWYRRRYEWELTGEPDTEAITFTPADPRALQEARTRSLTEAPPLSMSPPIRLEAVDFARAAGSRAAGAARVGDGGPPCSSEAESLGEAPRTAGLRNAPPPAPTPSTTQGTVLVLTINHTALDGPACLRILATAAELYSGSDNSPTAPPTRTPRAPQEAPGIPTSWSPPARVAQGTPEPSPGNGVLVTELPLPHRPKGSPYTANDQLMVTTALTIAHWNREHGIRPRRPLRITMPVDDRPRDTTMPIGNGTRLVEVPFLPTELHVTDMPALLRRTAERTRALKSLPRPQLGHGATLLTAPWAPVAVRAALTRTLRRAAAPWTSTTLLSNIGRIPYPLDFGAEAGRAHAVWFSAPARMPRGLTVTTASTAGRLHLALRWSRALLSHGDGAHLRDLFEHYLHTTVVTP